MRAGRAGERASLTRRTTDHTPQLSCARPHGYREGDRRTHYRKLSCWVCRWCRRRQHPPTSESTSTKRAWRLRRHRHTIKLKLSEPVPVKQQIHGVIRYLISVHEDVRNAAAVVADVLSTEYFARGVKRFLVARHGIRCAAC